MLTINIIHLKKKVELVCLCAIDELRQTLLEFFQADVLTPLFVKNVKEPFRKERLRTCDIRGGQCLFGHRGMNILTSLMCNAVLNS